jgi:hypothetical protein
MNAKLAAVGREQANYVGTVPTCRLLRATEEGRWTVWLRGVTARHAELIADRPVKADMALTLMLPSGPRLLHVTRAAALPGGREWSAGGVFFRELTPEECIALETRGAPDDTRVPLLPEVRCRRRCLLIRATEEGPWPAALHGVAPRGLRLQTSRPFQPGVFLTIELATTGVGRDRPRLMRVTQLRPEPWGRLWIIGGVLLSRLTESEQAGLSALVVRPAGR